MQREPKTYWIVSVHKPNIGTTLATIVLDAIDNSARSCAGDAARITSAYCCMLLRNEAKDYTVIWQCEDGRVLEYDGDEALAAFDMHLSPIVDAVMEQIEQLHAAVEYNVGLRDGLSYELSDVAPGARCIKWSK